MLRALSSKLPLAHSAAARACRPAAAVVSRRSFHHEETEPSEHPIEEPIGVKHPKDPSVWVCYPLEQTLEWTLSSPPPLHQFDEPPIIVEIEHLPVPDKLPPIWFQSEKRMNEWLTTGSIKDTAH